MPPAAARTKKVEGETAGRLHHDNKQQAAHRKGRERPIQQRFGRRHTACKRRKSSVLPTAAAHAAKKKGETAIFPFRSIQK